MGSLTSTPKVPTAPKSQSYSASLPIEETKEEAVDTQELESTQRKKSLLARDRSRTGTINTTLKGVLSGSDEGLERKTLLGQ